MKSVILAGKKRIEIVDRPAPPSPGENDVKVRMAAVGICGSDLHYYRNGRIGDQVIEFPFIVGHEGSAVVVETGKKVRNLATGDLVAIDPALACGSCDQCRSGREHTCRDLLFLGCPGQLPGCLSEFMLLPARNCFLLPEALSPVEGALIEPFSIGLYAWELFKAGRSRGGSPDRGLDLGILGAGPIGLSILLAAGADGISSVYVTDPIAARRKIAERVGAAWSGRPDSGRPEKLIRERIPLGLDAVFECCGEQSALDQAVDLLKPGGTLAVVGIPESDRVSFDIHRLRRKEIRILNVRRQNRCTGKAIALAAAGDVDLGFIATHRFPLKRAAAAFELADGYRDGVLRAVIDFPIS